MSLYNELDEPRWVARASYLGERVVGIQTYEVWDNPEGPGKLYVIGRTPLAYSYVPRKVGAAIRPKGWEYIALVVYQKALPPLGPDPYDPPDFLYSEEDLKPRVRWHYDFVLLPSADRAVSIQGIMRDVRGQTWQVLGDLSNFLKYQSSGTMTLPQVNSLKWSSLEFGQCEFTAGEHQRQLDCRDPAYFEASYKLRRVFSSQGQPEIRDLTVAEALEHSRIERQLQLFIMIIDPDNYVLEMAPKRLLSWDDTRQVYKWADWLMAAKALETDQLKLRFLC
jgi:hypothetical protein